jgi:hypothetical protein
MRKYRNIVMALLGTAALSVALMLTGPAIANASQADCVNGANGFIDISDNANGLYEVGAPIGANGEIVDIEASLIRGTERGWAHLTGAVPGDQMWMDWTRDNGHSWIQCGPFYATQNGQSLTSAAQRTDPSPNWRFRAGMNVGGTVLVSAWW